MQPEAAKRTNKSGPQNKLLQFNKNLPVLYEIVWNFVRTLKQRNTKKKEEKRMTAPFFK